MSRSRLTLVAALVVVGVVLGALLLGRGPRSLRLSGAGDAAATYTYVIPAGTGAEIDAGRPVDLLPERLTAHVGEVLRIVNHDDRGHLVGPFFVGAGQTLTQRFESVGTLVGACSVHPDGRFQLDVLP